ncbi:uncharacterized protein LOC130596616 [Pezoporus wallicus]|uniref:uncharacterized protein LOC130596616 n=1 Tax=Pezoporus wallicus TaxID=35540 RepID=UPI00254E486A|nr:uncharacterized protein LOC130596616 [Pezoporus wallicus]
MADFLSNYTESQPIKKNETPSLTRFAAQRSHRTSPHLTAPHRTSPHLTAPHRTSPHLTAPHRTSPHLTAPHRTSPHLTAPHRTRLSALGLLRPATGEKPRPNIRPATVAPAPRRPLRPLPRTAAWRGLARPAAPACANPGVGSSLRQEPGLRAPTSRGATAWASGGTDEERRRSLGGPACLPPLPRPLLVACPRRPPPPFSSGPVPSPPLPPSLLAPLPKGHCQLPLALRLPRCTSFPSEAALHECRRREAVALAPAGVPPGPQEPLQLAPAF